MIKRIIFSLTLLSVFYKVNSQGLIKGSSLPEIISDQTINFPSNIFRLSDYKGKPLIIDFWSFYCSYCLKNFPKAELLQKKFEGKVQIILVNQESLLQTKALFEKFKTLKTKIRMPNLPMMTGDSVFSKLFPINGLPMIVWIDADGKFRYCSSEINEKELTAFLNGQTPDLVEKKPKKDFINRRTLFEQKNKDYLNDIVYYSYISHYVDGSDIGNSNLASANNGKDARLSRNAGSIADLLITAYGENDIKYVFRKGVNVEFDVSDKSKYILPKRDSLTATEYINWIKNYYFRYDCVVPKEKRHKLFEYMRQDICRYFDLNVKVEQRRMKCLALVRTSDSLKIKSWGMPNTDSFKKQKISERIDSLYFADMPIEDFVRTLQIVQYHLGIKIPIVDCTSYSGHIDIAIPNMDDSETTLEYWKQQLKYYDLALIEKECFASVLVIQEN